jgi:hypothetical protein
MLRFPEQQTTNSYRDVVLSTRLETLLESAKNSTLSSISISLPPQYYFILQQLTFSLPEARAVNGLAGSLLAKTKLRYKSNDELTALCYDNLIFCQDFDRDTVINLLSLYL